MAHYGAHIIVASSKSGSLDAHQAATTNFYPFHLCNPAAPSLLAGCTFAGQKLLFFFFCVTVVEVCQLGPPEGVGGGWEEIESHFYCLPSRKYCQRFQEEEEEEEEDEEQRWSRRRCLLELERIYLPPLAMDSIQYVNILCCTVI